MDKGKNFLKMLGIIGCGIGLVFGWVGAIADIASNEIMPKEKETATVTGVSHSRVKTDKGDFFYTSAAREFNVSANKSYDFVVQKSFFGLGIPYILYASEVCP